MRNGQRRVVSGVSGGCGLDVATPGSGGCGTSLPHRAVIAKDAVIAKAASNRIMLPPANFFAAKESSAFSDSARMLIFNFSL